MGANNHFHNQQFKKIFEGLKYFKNSLQSDIILAEDSDEANEEYEFGFKSVDEVIQFNKSLSEQQFFNKMARFFNSVTYILFNYLFILAQIFHTTLQEREGFF